MATNRPTLSLLDENGVPLVSLVGGKEEPFLALINGTGEQISRQKAARSCSEAAGLLLA